MTLFKLTGLTGPSPNGFIGCNLSNVCIVLLFLTIICRIDVNFAIKIADFGLTENVYVRNYFRLGAEASVKLPVKWMAPESLQDGVFSEKSDVVRLLI